MPKLSLQNITHIYRAGRRAVQALADVDLTFGSGRLSAIVGPSGSGKTTLLRILAGLERPTGGTVAFDGDDVTHVAPRHRGVGLVPQGQALYPHMTVARNLAFGLRVAGVPRPEIDRRVEDIAHRVGVGELLGRRATRLSGGEAQRVALARAVIGNPRILLLDEPLAHLDSGTRRALQDDLRNWHRSFELTTVLVTHDQQIAMALADDLVVLRDGRIQQAGSPDDIYHHPANRFVATFFGTVPMNCVLAELQNGANGPHLRIADQRVTLPADRDKQAAVAEGPVWIGFRAEQSRLSSSAEPESAQWPVTVQRVAGAEGRHEIKVQAAGIDQPLHVVTGEACFAPRDEAVLSIATQHLHLFAADDGQRRL